MPGILDTIKPAVRALRAYTLSPYRASVKINQNENPWDAPAPIKEETLRRWSARQWSRYPDFVPASLHERLAEFSGWRADGIIGGNGSNELIQALLMVTVGEGKRVLISEPTFALYRQVVTVLGGQLESTALTTNLQYDIARLREAIEKVQPDVTIICSPNNPTGCLIDDQDLVTFLQAAHGIVVIDEAYRIRRSLCRAAVARSSEPGRAANLFESDGPGGGPRRLFARRSGVGARSSQGCVAIQLECIFPDSGRSGPGDV
jgi:histidinol-phosphate/aromatic aminotransferase/cobyric acid decarboxylase-like protein